MFGRNKKRIEALEQQIAEFKRELGIIKNENVVLRSQVDTLEDEMVVAHFDTDTYIAILQENDMQEKADTLLRIKEAYEKKLRRFIRTTTAKKKLKPKPATDGKETPEAAE